MAENVILHPTDGSEASRKALEFAVELAKSRGATLVVLHVQVHHGRGVPLELAEFEKIENLRVSEAALLHQAAEAIANRVAGEAQRMGVKEVEALAVEGDPAKVIVDMAKAREADLIVIGSRGLGDAAGLLLGSVSHKVAHSAPCTCVIVR